MSQERWSSNWGAILAVAGSAVGLGNFLRFPGQAAQFGGGAFMFAYFVSFLLIGLPIAWTEWIMGRAAGRNGHHSAPGILGYLGKNKNSKYFGILALLIPLIVYMYYSCIQGWCLAYAVNFFRGELEFTPEFTASQFFGNFVGTAKDGSAFTWGLKGLLPYLVFVLILNLYFIWKGVSAGIEKICRIGMPLLIALAFIILIRVLTLSPPDKTHPENNVWNGLGYMWNPTKVVVEKREAGKWSHMEELVDKNVILVAEQKAKTAPDLRVRRIGMGEQLKNPDLWLAAAGQIFFSVSIGFGIILVYASYLTRENDVVLNGLAAASTNEFCEVGLGGLLTLPAGIAFFGVAGVAGQGTFGLGFQVLPRVFSSMPGGNFFGGLFFFMLFLAALTSALSMLQPGIAFLQEAFKVSKAKALALLGFLTTLGAFFVAYYSKNLKALDTMDFWVGTFLIFILAGFQVYFFNFSFGVERGIKEAKLGAKMNLPKSFPFLIRWVSPIFLLTVFSLWILKNLFGVHFGGSGKTSPYIQDLFSGDPVALMSIGLILSFALFLLLVIAKAKHLGEKDNTQGEDLNI